MVLFSVFVFEGSLFCQAKKQVSINSNLLTVEIADTKNSRELGLMFRDKLDEGSGMLFIYNSPQILGFWMENTYIPLDLAYIDKNKKIIQIQKMRPKDRTSVVSKVPVLYALEVNSGWFSKHNIRVGDYVEFCFDKK